MESRGERLRVWHKGVSFFNDDLEDLMELVNDGKSICEQNAIFL